MVTGPGGETVDTGDLKSSAARRAGSTPALGTNEAPRLRTLVTGYGPFGKIVDNPSALLARECGRPHRVLEVAFEAADEFVASLDPSTFDRLLLIGVAAGRKHMTPELYARNQIGRTRDVRGNDRFGPIVASSPLLLSATLWDVEELGELCLDPRIRISCDAGRYLCNYVSYRALSRFPDKEVGFLHVPDPADMPLEVQAGLLQRILRVIEPKPILAEPHFPTAMELRHAEIDSARPELCAQVA